MGEFTTTTAAAYIPEVWTSRVMQFAYERRVVADLVTRIDAKEAQFGDIFHMPIELELTVSTKSADTAVTFTANTTTDRTVTVNNYEYVAIAIPFDILKMSRYDLAAINQRAMGRAIAMRHDSILMDLDTGFSQTSGTDGAGLGLGTIVDASRQLDVAGAPEDDRFLVVHPNGWADLISTPEIRSVAVFPQQRILARNELAELFGVRVFKSRTANTTAGGERNLLFHREAMGLVVSIDMDFIIQDVADNIRREIVGLTLYGEGELRDTFGVQCLS